MAKVKNLVLQGKSYPVAFNNVEFVKFGKIQGKSFLELQDYKKYTGDDLICLAKLALKAGKRAMNEDPQEITNKLVNDIVCFDQIGFERLIREIPELLKEANLNVFN